MFQSYYFNGEEGSSTKSLFRSLGEVTERIIFTGSFILVFCVVSKNSVAFLSFFSKDKKETAHNNVKTGPTNLFEMENGPNHLFLNQKVQKESGSMVISIYGSIFSLVKVRKPSKF